MYGKGANLNNLEYCKKTLELRKAIIDDGGVDPFVPAGHNIAPTADDYTQAEKVANYIQDAIDYADGDSELFTQELQRNMKDVPLPKRRH